MQEQRRIFLRSPVQKQHGMAVAYLKTIEYHCNRIRVLGNDEKMNEETAFKLFKLLETDPNISQRELAKKLGISLGKTNYCLKGLMEEGWLKACNFKNSNNKIAYAYVLTPSGLREKARITVRYLKNKVHDYETLKNEIEKLRQEASEN